MNGNGGNGVSDLDHMLNIVFFNHWAAIARKEQHSNILDMENTPLFGIPSTTIITSPINNSTGLNKTVSFSWEPVFATDQYRIQIATDDQFTNIELEKLVFRKDTTITLIGSGNYYVRVRAENSKGNSEWSATTYFQTLTTGLMDNLFEKDIWLYPNPAKSTIYIKFGLLHAQNLRITISDLSGKVVKVINHLMPDNNCEFSLDIQSLASGLYFLKIQPESTGKDGWKKTFKFTKQ
jgi:hypothetical protein